MHIRDYGQDNANFDLPNWSRSFSPSDTGTFLALFLWMGWGFGFEEGAFISAPVSLLPLPANNGNQTITHEARHILALLAFVASFV
jgi:hypothetical protein